MRKTGLFFTLAVAISSISMSYVYGQQNDAIQAAFTDNEFRNQLRNDLQLTDDQAIKLRDMGDEFRKEMETMFRENIPQMMNKEKRDEVSDRLRTEGFKKGEAFKEKMRGVLNEKQYAQLQERSFQMTGGLQSGLFSTGFLDTLELTPEQVKKIQQLQKQATGEALALLDKIQGASAEERTAIMQQLQGLGEKYSKLIREILTDEQKVRADKLIEDTPDFIWNRLPQNRNRTREWRPGANSWQPGQGVPEGLKNKNSETKPEREHSGRRVPGAQE
ncbi:MAG: hypothetical protein LBJ67_17680 [Planctomycetaceae bacterium]|nr:hypothetical protein [Planctomycetaceae bacterium]